MKTEGDFNRLLSRELRKAGPGLYHLKTADRFTVGISDFLIWNMGKTVALETKFVNGIPSEKASLLKHPFSGAQITFLESMALSGNAAFGGIYLNELNLFYLIPGGSIPTTGNWKTKDFFKSGFPIFKLWSEINSLIGVMFGCEYCERAS